MKPSARLILIVVVLFGMLCSPAFVGAAYAEADSATPTPAPTEVADVVEAPAAIIDQGDFVVRYEEPEDESFTPYYESLKSDNLLQPLADSLNETFALPKDVAIVTTECGEVNAFYDAETASIQLCYELMDDFYKIFTEAADDPGATEQIDAAATNALLSTFYHELGHALIDLYHLPITGKEEDAVDQLSAFIMIDETSEGLKDALDGARSFMLTTDEITSASELPFWDTHSLDMQRFFNLVCWAYGENPGEREFLVTDGQLPEERAVRCPGEYAQIEYAWLTLLAPYIIGNDWPDRPDGLLQEPIEDRGEFKVNYRRPSSPELQAAFELVSTDNAFGEVVKSLNETFALPRNVRIIFQECGMVNAYYDPQWHSLNVCYELIDSFEKAFKAKAENPDDDETITNHVLNTLLFVFFHEMGHGLIDLYKLPITGNEEDAVDQLATLISTGEDVETSRDALDGAQMFVVDNLDDTPAASLSYSDEHSLDSQRYYNIVCWVYGQNPEANADLVGEDALPEERAEWCQEEWTKLNEAWLTLLAPFVKE